MGTVIIPTFCPQLCFICSNLSVSSSYSLDTVTCHSRSQLTNHTKKDGRENHKKCPKCLAIVEVSTGGEKNLLHHQRSKTCCMASVKSNNILSYYQPQPPPLPASQAPPSTHPPVATLVLPMLAVEQEDAEAEQNSSNWPALSSLTAPALAFLLDRRIRSYRCDLHGSK